MKTIRLAILLAGLHALAGCASGTDAVSPADGTVSDSRQAGKLPLSTDADQDGVADANDRCANTLPRSLVDNAGCEVTLGVIEELKFGPNETDLSTDARIALSKLVDVFLRYPDVVISADGHTDNRGSAADNLELSKERILSVVRYMVANGIAAERIKPYGYGESRPRAANATPEGREQNRRIEINVVEGLS